MDQRLVLYPSLALSVIGLLREDGHLLLKLEAEGSKKAAKPWLVGQEGHSCACQ